MDDDSSGAHGAMTSEPSQEYDEALMALLEAVWGEGFMSPGGTGEVDRYLQGIDVAGRSVLDIGCGLGGVDLHLATHHRAAHVTGIDIEAPLIARCIELVQRTVAAGNTTFLCVEPGVLAFKEASFDIVTSKDSIIHIADKRALAKDVFRVLQPGGWFAASDWLAGYDEQPSLEMQEYLVAEGLDFGLAPASVYRQALHDAGFDKVQLNDRNDWYRQHARMERDALRGHLYGSLSSSVGKTFLDHQIDVWDKMIVALDQGQLRPTHLRARKAAAVGA